VLLRAAEPLQHQAEGATAAHPWPRPGDQDVGVVVGAVAVLDEVHEALLGQEPRLARDARQLRTPARRAVYNNRARLLSEVARQAFKLRAERVKRSFALILDRGGLRRAWLRGRENVHKRYLIHVAGYNLGLIMRLLTGAGTPREFLARTSVWFAAMPIAHDGLIVILLVAAGDQIAIIAVSLRSDPLA
jgi:hypothetical protein